MLNDKDRVNYEQNLALLGEMLPRSWAILYNGCLQNGFNMIQAMDLVKTYILSNGSAHIMPPQSTDGPSKPDDAD